MNNDFVFPRPARGTSNSNGTATRIELAALTSPAAYLTESGREGWFHRTTVDLSASVAVDTQQAIFVPFASDATGASGGYMRTECEFVDPRWAGIPTLSQSAVDQTASLRTLFMAAARLRLPVDARGARFKLNTDMLIIDTLFDDYEYHWRNIVLDASVRPLAGRIINVRHTYPTLLGSLSADALIDTATCSVTGLTGLAAGDWCWIVSDKRYTAHATDASCATAGECLMVKDVTGTTVIFWKYLCDTYTVAANAKLFKAQSQGRVILGDGFEMYGPPDFSCYGVDSHYGFKNEYHNCYFENTLTTGINELYCIGSMARGTIVVKGSAPNFGWGIAATGSQDGHYGNIIGIDLYQTLLTGQGNLHAIGAKVSRNISADTVHAINPRASIVDQHPGGGYYSIATVMGDYAATSYTSNPPITLEGAGGWFGSLKCRVGDAETAPSSGVFSGAPAFQFATKGYGVPRFTPNLHINKIQADLTLGRSFSITNDTNVGAALPNPYPNGIPMYVTLDEAMIRSGSGAAVSANSGDIYLTINGGRIYNNSSNGIGLTTTSLGRVYFNARNLTIGSYGGTNLRPISVTAGYTTAHAGEYSAYITLTDCLFDMLSNGNNNYADSLVIYRNTIDQAGSTTALSGIAKLLFDQPAQQVTAALLTTAGNETYTAAQVLGGTIVRDCTGAGRTDTLPIATDLVAAVYKPYVGKHIDCLIVNGSDAAETITIAAGTGGSFAAAQTAASRVIAQNNSKLMRIRLTNVTTTPTYVVYL